VQTNNREKARQKREADRQEREQAFVRETPVELLIERADVGDDEVRTAASVNQGFNRSCLIPYLKSCLIESTVFMVFSVAKRLKLGAWPKRSERYS
jgi:hypothetical protein